MSFAPLPTTACWEHRGLRSGFEVAYFTSHSHGLRIDGTTTGLQDGATFVVSYVIDLARDWTTREARIVARSGPGTVERVVESDGDGHWLVDGSPAPLLDGCRDIDLESSAVTNALPVHRLGLAVGETTPAPAAYVLAMTGSLDRLEQRYTRVEDEDDRQHYDYEAPVFDFRCRLVYDRFGLVLDYPGIAVRAG